MVCSGTALPYHVNYVDKEYAITDVFPRTSWKILRSLNGFANHKLVTTGLVNRTRSSKSRVHVMCLHVTQVFWGFGLQTTASAQETFGRNTTLEERLQASVSRRDRVTIFKPS
jgi:hypothetical protein